MADALGADFGIALAVQSAGGARMTQTGLSLRTPQYMSPEQAIGEKAIDLRSDLYALGAISYEMLVGEAPFTGPSVQAIVARVLTEEPRSIALQRKAVPESVESAVMRALEPFTSNAEGLSTLALSPDGAQLVFVSRLGAQPQLFVCQLSDFSVRALEGTTGATTPFFSLDGDISVGSQSLLPCRSVRITTRDVSTR